MKAVKIEPGAKSIEILDSIDIAETIEKLPKNAVEVEKGIIIIPICSGDRESFFYYVIQSGLKGRIFTFKGTAVVIGKGIEKKFKEIKEKIIW